MSDETVHKVNDETVAMDLRFVKISDQSELAMRMGEDAPGTMVLTMAPVSGYDEEGDEIGMSIVTDIQGVDTIADVRAALIELVAILDTAEVIQKEEEAV